LPWQQLTQTTHQGQNPLYSWAYQRGKSAMTADLVAALNSGRLYAAGLNVTNPELLPTDSARRVALVAIENLRRYVAGEALLNVVDLRRCY